MLPQRQPFLVERWRFLSALYLQPLHPTAPVVVVLSQPLPWSSTTPPQSGSPAAGLPASAVPLPHDQHQPETEWGPQMQPKALPTRNPESLVLWSSRETDLRACQHHQTPPQKPCNDQARQAPPQSVAALSATRKTSVVPQYSSQTRRQQSLLTVRPEIPPLTVSRHRRAARRHPRGQSRRRDRRRAASRLVPAGLLDPLTAASPRRYPSTWSTASGGASGSWPPGHA